MSEHDWFRDNLAVYSAHGLTADEGLRLERHAAQCAACAQELVRCRLFDQALERLCAPVNFAADWDDRVLAKLHAAPPPPRRWSAPARWAAAAAAVVFIASLGAAVMAVAEQGLVAFPGSQRMVAVGAFQGFDASRALVGLSGAIETELASDHFEGRRKLRSLSVENAGGVYEGKEADEAAKRINLNTVSDPAILAGLASESNGDVAKRLDNLAGFQAHAPALGLTVRHGQKVHTSITGGIIGGKDTNKVMGQEVTLPSGAYDSTASMVPDGGAVALGGITVNGEVAKRLDALGKLQDGEAKEGFTAGIDLYGWSSGSKPAMAVPPAAGGDVYSLGRGEKLEQAPGRRGFVNVDGTATELVPPVSLRSGASKLGKSDPKSPAAEAAPAPDKARQAGATENKGLAALLKPTTEYHNSAIGGKAEQEAAGVKVLVIKALDPANTKKAMDALGGFGASPKAPEEKREESPGKEKASPEVARNPFVGALPAAQGAAAQPKPDPQVAQRKIIRTGDLEFEVESFDNAVNDVTRLIGAIPGAFVATVNSEKLPNGKVRGSIVVRVPPEHLDKFVLDLRKDLGKAGELKSQKIGSQDVTKQYTDIESRLRAARAMEERLINIIKTGKGEIKDLITAERELGVWRTKIEESEGEIRFYNNQVGLSTLTITAYEKEIRAAAAMVVTEHVNMKIEADDVEKSLQAALTAVTEAKGRVTKSDLKQHAAGQLEAVVVFEVAPASAGPVKDKLKTLGIVTHHDAQRVQQAEGGVTPAAEPGGSAPRMRTNDVQFTVTLYNVANIQPRETFQVQVAVADVPAEYGKLLDLVRETKGQVRVSQLDEKDKANIFAQLDFDVPAGQRAGVDKQLAALGDVVSRSTQRAGPGETATDRKVGYRLVLKSVTSIPPRETYTLAAYSLDVPAAYKKLMDAAGQAKGTLRTTQINETDKQNVTAQLDFDVPAGDPSALEKLLDELTDVHSRTTSRVPPNEIATDKKVGYRLTLRSQVPPRETVDLEIEAADVDQAAAKLAELVRAAKGKIVDQAIAETSSGKATAVQLFDVPLSAKDDLMRKFKLVGKIRAQKATQNVQAPDSKLGKAQILVRVSNTNPIVPSDEGLWPQIRTSLGFAFRLLSVSLMFVIVGISVLLPWALVIWIALKLFRRGRAKQAAA